MPKSIVERLAVIRKYSNPLQEKLPLVLTPRIELSQPSEKAVGAYLDSFCRIMEEAVWSKPDCTMEKQLAVLRRMGVTARVEEANWSYLEPYGQIGQEAITFKHGTWTIVIAEECHAFCNVTGVVAYGPEGI